MDKSINKCKSTSKDAPEQGDRASSALRGGKKGPPPANVKKRMNAASRLPHLPKVYSNHRSPPRRTAHQEGGPSKGRPSPNHRRQPAGDGRRGGHHMSKHDAEHHDNEHLFEAQRHGLRWGEGH
ncbi:hypothetical protein HPB48_003528 [Haemaphysalis longicornis]|uniref:Uncharacterized protein n=1 Tax=Haemaphysalis longicornis TaxID=44386 RepID=A0A9J6G400_HAELO|nr:hypothetical protein HPB48_003528 [Haemaphysalis longicornis]